MGWSPFETEFVSVDGAVLREPLSRCWRYPFENVEPVRSFPSLKGQRHFPGWWWSATTGGHVGYESWLERDHVMVMDFDPLVVGFASQPFWLHWPGEERARRHAPDFFARLADGTGVVVDVRPDDRIEPRDAEAFAITARACAEAGWQFRRVGTLSAVFTANLRWLSRYRHPRCAGNEETAVRLLEAFAEPAPLFAGAGSVGDTLIVLPVLFHLMWRKSLIADLKAALLSPTTMVRQGDGVPR
uniref:TnsA-like heteromeric transposase endonuclease subunit n=1 Tax=Streptomyces sp. SID8382 TaxID=2690362 RepID=UPI002F914815